jgi:hypothetical protein
MPKRGGGERELQGALRESQGMVVGGQLQAQKDKDDGEDTILRRVLEASLQEVCTRVSEDSAHVLCAHACLCT